MAGVAAQPGAFAGGRIKLWLLDDGWLEVAAGPEDEGEESQEEREEREREEWVPK